MTTIEGTIPEAEAAAITAQELFDEVAELTVDNAEDYEVASRLRQGLKRCLDDIERERVALKEPSLAEGRRIDAAFKVPSNRIKEATMAVDRKISAWRAEQDRIRREAERKAREEAERERLKLQKAAERAEKRGLVDTADELQRAADHVPVPVIESHVPKVEGLSAVKRWVFTIEDPDLVPREFCVPSEALIRARVQAMRGATNIPGVTVRETEEFRSSRE
jgi:hypothetical protein